MKIYNHLYFKFWAINWHKGVIISGPDAEIENLSQNQIFHFAIICGLIWKDPKWVEMSKLIWVANLNIAYGDPVWKQDNIYQGADRSEFLVLLGLESYNAVSICNMPFKFWAINM